MLSGICVFVSSPQVAPITIHPAHEKAANYFGFEIIHVPVGNDFKPDLEDYERVTDISV